MLIKIATWNVNSVRSRLDSIEKFLEEHPVSILAIQECKCSEEDFPSDFFSNLGYDYQFLKVRKKMLGVAILSKIEITEGLSLDIAKVDDCRHLSVNFSDIELHNFYIPAGGYEPNIETNPKYKYKLEYINSCANWFVKNRSNKAKMLLLGDLNVAPLENDVWNHNKMAKVVSHTEAEISALNKMQESVGWQDAHRFFISEDQKVYTWWTYRFPDWQLHDRGRKLDHIWFTKNLTKNIKKIETVKETRAFERPSDHVPVILTIKI